MAPAPPPRRPAAGVCSRGALLLALALLLAAAVLAAAVLLPHLRLSIALILTGLALGVVRWRLFGGVATPFARVGRLLQGRRARIKAH